MGVRKQPRSILSGRGDPPSKSLNAQPMRMRRVRRWSTFRHNNGYTPVDVVQLVESYPHYINRDLALGTAAVTVVLGGVHYTREHVKIYRCFELLATFILDQSVYIQG